MLDVYLNLHVSCSISFVVMVRSWTLCVTSYVPFFLSIFLFVDVGCPTIKVHSDKSMNKKLHNIPTLAL